MDINFQENQPIRRDVSSSLTGKMENQPENRRNTKKNNRRPEDVRSNFPSRFPMRNHSSESEIPGVRGSQTVS